MYTLDACRTVIRALRTGNRLKKYNDYIMSVGLTLQPTIHLADRLYDHKIDLQQFVDSFFQICDKHLLLLVHQMLTANRGIKFSINELVFVFERGNIDKNHIIIKTIYPLRQGKIVDFDASIIETIKQDFLSNSLHELESVI